MTYERIKVRYEGVIDGLIVGLAHEATPDSLADLRAKLRRAFVEYAAFLKRVGRLLPKGRGAKGALAEIVQSVVGPVVKSVKHSYIHRQDADG